MPKSIVIVESPAKAKTLGEVPRPGLQGPRLLRPRPRSAAQGPGCRPRERVQADLRSPDRQGEDGQRAQEGRQDRRERLPRGRPRSGGRGDLLAPPGDPEARREEDDLPARAVQRDHEEGRARGDGGRRRDRRPPRRRATGAPDHRPAGRLRGLGPALEEGVAGPLGRTRPDRGAADHLRARVGHRGVRPGRVLDRRRPARGSAPHRRSPRASSPSTERSSSSTARTRASRTRPRRAGCARTWRRPPGR